MSEVIDYMNTDRPKDSKIMVIGVGGGGGNAVKYMYDIGVHNVYFMVCNTDAQALQKSPIPQKIQLGGKLTKGLGAGNKPEKGKEAALESVEEIKQCFISADVEMVFITAGMGGGTGTGAAPVIAQVAKELGILTVGIVTIPFRIEGPMRLRQACKGLEELEQHVDSMIVIDNENICKMYGDLDFSDAFSKADDILTIAAKGIAETITKEHRVNVDFADVFTTMSNSGVVLLGYASSDINSENVAIELTERALLSPLLNQNNVYGAEKILINISWNRSELKMGQLHAIIKHIQAAAGSNANIIWGAGVDETLGENEVSLIIIATGFPSSSILAFLESDIEGIGEARKEENKEETTTQNEPKKTIESSTSEVTPTNQHAETEYVMLDDEPAAPVEPDNRDKAGDEDGWVILSTHDDSQNDEADTKQVSQVTKPATNSTHSLFDTVQNIDINSRLTLHNDSSTTSKREYTVDELDNMPAYIRRNIVAQLNQKLHSSEKTSLELDE